MGFYVAVASVVAVFVVVVIAVVFFTMVLVIITIIFIIFIQEFSIPNSSESRGWHKQSKNLPLQNPPPLKKEE